LVYEAGEPLAHALDLSPGHGELARLGAAPLAELADEHEPLQVQDQVVQLAEARHAASSSGTGSGIGAAGAGTDLTRLAAISAPATRSPVRT
jgi:hypothetical protein